MLFCAFEFSRLSDWQSVDRSFEVINVIAYGVTHSSLLVFLNWFRLFINNDGRVLITISRPYADVPDLHPRSGFSLFFCVANIRLSFKV